MRERTKAMLDGLLIGAVAFLMFWSLMLTTQFEFWHGSGVIPLFVLAALLGAAIGWLSTGSEGKAPLPVPLRWVGVLSAVVLLAYIVRSENTHSAPANSSHLDSTLLEGSLNADAKAKIVARVLQGVNTEELLGPDLKKLEATTVSLVGEGVPFKSAATRHSYVSRAALAADNAANIARELGIARLSPPPAPSPPSPVEPDPPKSGDGSQPGGGAAGSAPPTPQASSNDLQANTGDSSRDGSSPDGSPAGPDPAAPTAGQSRGGANGNRNAIGAAAGLGVSLAGLAGCAAMGYAAVVCAPVVLMMSLFTKSVIVGNAVDAAAAGRIMLDVGKEAVAACEGDSKCIESINNMDPGFIRNALDANNIPPWARERMHRLIKQNLPDLKRNPAVRQIAPFWEHLVRAMGQPTGVPAARVAGASTKCIQALERKAATLVTCDADAAAMRDFRSALATECNGLEGDSGAAPDLLLDCIFVRTMQSKCGASSSKQLGISDEECAAILSPQGNP